MIIKKNRPTLELRAIPNKDGTLICRITQTAITETLEVKDDWKYVRVRAKDGIKMGWIKRETCV